MTRTPHLEKIVVDLDTGELLALGDHPVVAADALVDVPHVDLSQPGTVIINGTVAGQPAVAVYTIRGKSLDESVWALSRRQ